MRLIRQLLLGAVILIVVLTAVGTSYQWWTTRADLKRFPPPGRLLTVDGVVLHLDCRGSGGPVVILESGLGAGSAEWGTVPEAVARITTVCAYDRPGMGWSRPLRRTADSAEVADRLYRLLAAGHVAGPYVLAGWSAGGVYVREYYRRHPEGVVGMVLVDSSHEQQGDRLPVTGEQKNAQRQLDACTWLQPLGVVRLMGALDGVVDQPGIPDRLKPVLLATMNQSDYCSAVRDEMASFQREVHDVDPPASLGDLPLTVLTQGNEPKGDPALGTTDEQARQQRVVWNVLQGELTALSSRSRHLIAEHSGHAIQLQQPELVVAAISDMVESLRGSPERNAGARNLERDHVL